MLPAIACRLRCLARDDYPLFIKKYFSSLPFGSRIDRFVYYPSESPHLLLVLLLSVYVNLVKELFLLALFHVVSSTVFPKASAKVLLFSELTKFFTKYF